MEGYLLAKDEVTHLSNHVLSKGYALFAPVKGTKKHAFKRIADSEQSREISLDFVRTTIPPLKALLIPPRETLLRMDGGKFADTVSEIRGKTAVLGVHPCDVNAASLLDRVYLDRPKDPYFEARRKNLVILALNCTSFDDYCFCTSFGTGPSLESGYDVLMTDLGNRYLVEVGSERGSELLEGFYMPQAADGDFLEKDERLRKVKGSIRKRHVNTANLQRVMMGAMYNPIWGELASSCTGCAACNMVCPTCFCFNVVDEASPDLRSFSRNRIWDGCLLWEYAEVALGGNFRRDLSARLRQFVNHKFNYWVNQYGAWGCVGCGRCIEQCPAGIDITKVVARIRGEAMI
jgi:ferredoxin